MDHKFTDSVTLDGTRLTGDGYLVTTARSVRTGVQIYAGSEVGRPDLARVNVYRAPEDVFHKDSLQSFSHAPVTLDHPAEAVTADNWSKLAVGEVSTDAQMDEASGWVRLPLVLKDAKAISAVQSGKRELSAGYSCELLWGDGVAPDGTPYHARQTNIKINHLAVVDRARAGKEARIGDNWGASPIPATDTENRGMTLKTVTVDGLPIETTEAGSIAISKLIADKAALAVAYDAEIDTLKAAVATADAALAQAEAARDAALAKVLDGAALDAAVAARADLIARAKAVAPKVVTDGKTDLDIKKAVLADRKIVLDGKSDAYIEARFDTLTEDAAGADRTALALGDTQQVADAASKEADAHAAYVKRMTGAK